MRQTIMVVPCYNEEHRLPVDAFRLFAAKHSTIRFVMVDDGSKDATADVLADLAAFRPRQFEVLALAANGGKAEAVRQGMVYAMRSGADYAGFIDADLAAPLEEVPRLIDVLERRGDVQVVVGSRLPLAGHTIHRRLIRRVLGRCFASVASGVLGVTIRDTQCGLKIFRAGPATARLFAEPFRSRWIFDVEVLARLIAHEGRDAAARDVYETPLEQWSEVAGSKLKSGDFAKAVFELAGIHATYLRGHATPARPAADADRAASRRAA